MIIKPIDWDKDGNVKDSKLFESAMQFSEREFGSRLANLNSYQKVFAGVRPNGEVNALGGLVLRYDCPLFHVARPAADRVAQRDALEASELLYNRLSWYIQDVGGGGLETFVYVDPATGGRWDKFLKDRGGREGCRWIFVP